MENQSQSEAMAEAKKEFAKQLVALVFMVIALAVMGMAHDPDFIRTCRMRVAEASRRLLSSAARKAGRISMGTELRTGIREYSLPYHLSVLRDKAHQAYEKAREL